MRTVNLYTENFLLNGRVRNFAKKIFHRKSLGPQKLQTNLIAGLDELGVAVKINKSPKDEVVCVLRESSVVDALVGAGVSNIILGPNLTAKAMANIYKRHGKFIKTILAPSSEVKKIYVHYGVNEEKITTWPVGINTEDFIDVSKIPKIYDALVYFKRRLSSELDEVVKLLERKNQSYKILEYGKYSELGFKNSLMECRYAVVLDGTESQGIALEEIMSSNLPMFVFDQIYLGDSSDIWAKENLTVTSVPFWSDACGMRVATDMYRKSKQQYFLIPQTDDLFQQFLSRMSEFQPRKFVLENLGLVDQAKKFLEIIEK